MRGDRGIFGTGDNGIFDGKASLDEAPLIHPEEKRTYFTCDIADCKEYRLAIDGLPAGGSGHGEAWLVVGGKHFCQKHRKGRELAGALGKKISENFFDGRADPEPEPDDFGFVPSPEAPPTDPPMPPSLEWLGYAFVGCIIVAVVIVLEVLCK